MTPGEDNHRGARTSSGATVLALLSCYGVVAFVSVLSLLGLSVDIDFGVWAAAISAFYGLAVLVIAIGAMRRGAFGPPMLAAIGFAVILWTMFGAYNWMTELLAFAILIAATIWDRAAAARR